MGCRWIFAVCLFTALTVCVCPQQAPAATLQFKIDCRINTSNSESLDGDLGGPIRIENGRLYCGVDDVIFSAGFEV